MPELPEVQTVVNHLARKIQGKVFLNSVVKVPKMVSFKFKEQIKQKKVLKVFRRAKLIVMELTDHKYLLVHLKMTGQLIFVDLLGQATGGGHPINSQGFNLTKPNKYTHIILTFTDQSQLLFHDVRKFGWLKVVDSHELEKIFLKHGLEPLSKEFTIKKFKEILVKKPNVKIKQFLLNPELIAGIGNIYADESLFKAKISPLRTVKTLRESEIKRLHQAIICKLKEAIKHGGTSVNTFVSSSGKRGKFADKLKVYGRKGQKCFKCGSILQKIKVGGRGTVYCRQCQK